MPWMDFSSLRCSSVVVKTTLSHSRRASIDRTRSFAAAAVRAAPATLHPMLSSFRFFIPVITHPWLSCKPQQGITGTSNRIEATTVVVPIGYKADATRTNWVQKPTACSSSSARPGVDNCGWNNGRVLRAGPAKKPAFLQHAILFQFLESARRKYTVVVRRRQICSCMPLVRTLEKKTDAINTSTERFLTDAARVDLVESMPFHFLPGIPNRSIFVFPLSSMLALLPAY